MQHLVLSRKEATKLLADLTGELRQNPFKEVVEVELPMGTKVTGNVLTVEQEKKAVSATTKKEEVK